MPLLWGGITVDQIVRIISLGVEKVGLSSSLISSPDLVNNASNVLVVVLLQLSTLKRLDFWAVMRL